MSVSYLAYSRLEYDRIDSPCRFFIFCLIAKKVLPASYYSRRFWIQ